MRPELLGQRSQARVIRATLSCVGYGVLVEGVQLSLIFLLEGVQRRRQPSLERPLPWCGKVFRNGIKQVFVEVPGAPMHPSRHRPGGQWPCMWPSITLPRICERPIPQQWALPLPLQLV